MQADEAQAVFAEWARIAQKGEALSLPPSLHDRIQTDLPAGSQWAVADARTLWALGADDVLHRLALDGQGQITSASWPLAPGSFTASHSTEPIEFYRDTETVQRHHWSFSIDGERLVTLTGTVYGERGRPRDRPDRLQRFAFELDRVATHADR